MVYCHYLIFYFIIGYYLKRKKIELENSLRVPPQNSPPMPQDVSPLSPQAPLDVSPLSPQAPQEPVQPLEPCNDINEQDQDNAPKRKVRKHHNDQENQDNAPKKRGRKPKSKIVK